MKLSKISTSIPVQKSGDGNLSPSQRELYLIDMQSLAPHGKYKDKPLHWIKVNDSSYWKWMELNGIAYSWNCIKLRSDAMQPEAGRKKYSHFISSDGSVWIELREHNQVTTPAPEDWYRGQKSHNMQVTFSTDHDDPKDSQVLIALTGSPQYIAEKLMELAKQADPNSVYKKPIQGMVWSAGGQSQVITPVYHGGKKY